MYNGLEITTIVGCKNQCSYCPQDKLIKAYLKKSDIIQMSFDTFKECIDKIPRTVGVHFSGFAEPWLNPECTKMVLYAHKRGFKITVFTTAIGMDISDVDLIKKIPFKEFCVHLPDNKGQTKIKVDEKYLEVINKLLNSHIENILFVSYQELPFELKQLLMNTKVNRWKLITKAGNIEVEGLSLQKRIKGKLLGCGYLYQNILLPNGEIVLCCMDYGLKHVIGNLLTSDYDSLFRSEEFSKVIKGLEDDSSNILCRYCEEARKRTLISQMIKLLQKSVQNLKDCIE